MSSFWIIFYFVISYSFVYLFDIKKDIMIKKILLCLWVFVFSFVGVSFSAWRLQTVWLQEAESIYDANYTLSFLRRWAVLSKYLWQAKSVLALKSDVLFWWMWDWYPYFYAPNKQGYFSEYCSCDPFNNDTVSPSNCSCLPLDENSKWILNSYFSQLTDWDYAYYDYRPRSYWWTSCSYDQYWVQICFSANSVWRSLCFKDASCYNWCQWWNNVCNNFCNNFNGCWWGLKNSAWYSNLNFANLPYNDIWLAPWQAWYDWGWNIDWSSSVWDNTTLSWNLMYSTCTNWYVVSQVSSWYWWINNVCYAWTTQTWIINDYVAFTPVSQWLNFKEVYEWSLNITINWANPYYDSYLNWFQTWLWAMQKYKLWQVSFEVFKWQPVYLYAYFNRLYENGVMNWSFDAYNIANFCKLALFSDLTQQYKWTYFSDVCSDLNYNSWNWWTVTTWEVWSIDNDNQEIIPWWSSIWWWGWWWGVWWWGWWSSSSTSSWNIVSVDWSWTLSGNTNQNFDWTTFINDFYQKLQSNFQKPYNWLVWIVPTYILVFLVALILFRFLSH